MASGTGSLVLDFGAAPGTNIAETVVTGQADISVTSGVEAYMMGLDTTATHNGYEHAIAPIKLSCTAISPGAGFTIQGSSEWRLTGTFAVRWVWAD